jgi:hypothetical protein
VRLPWANVGLLMKQKEVATSSHNHAPGRRLGSCMSASLEICFPGIATVMPRWTRENVRKFVDFFSDRPLN